MGVLKIFFIFIVLISAIPCSAGTTILVSAYGDGTCTKANVDLAIADAVSGDTVVCPNADLTWAASVTIPADKAIIFQGQGIGNTVISFGSIATMLSFGGGTRVTGFTFNTGRLSPTGRDWRIDHCRIEGNTNVFGDRLIAQGQVENENITGVIDHNEFFNTRILVYAYSNIMANAAWARPLGLGTGEAVYIEDNDFKFDAGPEEQQVLNQAVDSNYGGSYVVRYNTFRDAGVYTHGIHGPNRASRKWEVYNNVFTAYQVDYRGITEAVFAGMMRGGTGVWFNNELVGGSGTGAGQWRYTKIAIDLQRSCTSYTTSGKCDGSSAWDGNTGSGDATGYPCRDQIGRSNDAVLWISSPEGEYTQVLDPAYSWNNYRYPTETDRTNKTNGVAFSFDNEDLCAAQTAQIVSGVDYVNSATPKPGYTPYYYPHPLQDQVVPTMVSATIDSTGGFITFRGSENLLPTISTGFVLTLSGGAATATYSSGTGTAYLVYSLSRTVASGETGTYDYTQPGNGIEDSSGNDLASITGGAITNNSTSSGAKHQMGAGPTVQSGVGSTVQWFE